MTTIQTTGPFSHRIHDPVDGFTTVELLRNDEVEVTWLTQAGLAEIKQRIDELNARLTSEFPETAYRKPKRWNKRHATEHEPEHP
ncbi:MAG: hypothetical protein J5I81_02315 [Nitrococcus mobilis]|nr:hypothetical protein [Nitrococcus mobilis]